MSVSTTERAPLVSARPIRRFSLSDRHYKWILLLPAVLVVVGLTLFPLVFSLAITFTNWDLYSADSASFAGLSQWTRLLGDRGFLTPARNTVVFTAGVVPLEFVLGLMVALALNNATVGRTFFRVFFLVPLMVSPVATSFIMGRTMFDPNVGPIHDLLVRFGLPAVPWLTHPTWAMVTLMLID